MTTQALRLAPMALSLGVVAGAMPFAGAPAPVQSGQGVAFRDARQLVALSEHR